MSPEDMRIHNQREYEMAKSDLAGFEQSLAEWQSQEGSISPIEREAGVNQCIGLINCQKAAIEDYEYLTSDKCYSVEITDPDEAGRSLYIGPSLTRARIASGYTQEEFAGFIGWPVERVIEYEGEDYESMPLRLLGVVADVLGLKLAVKHGMVQLLVARGKKEFMKGQDPDRLEWLKEKPGAKKNG